MHILIKDKYLLYNDYKVKCSIGKRGINIKKKEGDLITPKGIFKIMNIYYRKDKVKNILTNFKMIPIKKNMGWCDDPRSIKYNKLIKYPFSFKSEKLYRSDNIYDIVLVLNFNMRPIKKNKGSAIFIHVASRKFSPTKGCVAIKKTDLKKIIRFITKKTKIKIC